jgi:hypothetical protein
VKNAIRVQLRPCQVRRQLARLQECHLLLLLLLHGQEAVHAGAGGLLLALGAHAELETGVSTGLGTACTLLLLLLLLHWIHMQQRASLLLCWVQGRLLLLLLLPLWLAE